MKHMKSIAWTALLVFAVLLASPPVTDAGSRGGGGSGHSGGHFSHGGHFHHHGFRNRVIVGVGVGPFFGAPYFWDPWYWGPYPYYSDPPPVYVSPPAPTQYWYYCPGAGGYYPSVPSCSEPWVQVPPR